MLTKSEELTRMVLVACLTEALGSTEPKETGTFIVGLIMKTGVGPDQIVYGLKEGVKVGLFTFHNQPTADDAPEAVSLSEQGARNVDNMMAWLDEIEPTIEAWKRGENVPTASVDLPTILD